MFFIIVLKVNIINVAAKSAKKTIKRGLKELETEYNNFHLEIFAAN